VRKTATSKEVWEVLAPLFGLEDMGCKVFELRLELGKPPEITLTCLAKLEESNITKEIATTFSLVASESATEENDE
jgi:hypothetical protein